jgi:hypothetical protein
MLVSRSAGTRIILHLSSDVWFAQFVHLPRQIQSSRALRVGVQASPVFTTPSEIKHTSPPPRVQVSGRTVLLVGRPVYLSKIGLRFWAGIPIAVQVRETGQDLRPPYSKWGPIPRLDVGARTVRVRQVPPMDILTFLRTIHEFYGPHD